MGEKAILKTPVREPRSAADVWLARAEQARRVALSLSLPDVALLEAYASECEGEATRILDTQAPPIAA